MFSAVIQGVTCQILSLPLGPWLSSTWMTLTCSPGTHTNTAYLCLPLSQIVFTKGLQTLKLSSDCNFLFLLCLLLSYNKHTLSLSHDPELTSEISSPPDPRSNISAVQTSNPEALSLTTFSSYWLKIMSVIFSQVPANCWRISIRIALSKFTMTLHMLPIISLQIFLFHSSFCLALNSPFSKDLTSTPNKTCQPAWNLLKIHVINHTWKLYILIYVFCFHLKNS